MGQGWRILESRRLRAAVPVVAAVSLIGCGTRQATPYPKYFEAAAVGPSREDPSNAFSAYERAANLVTESKVIAEQGWLVQTGFSDEDRARVRVATSGTRVLINRAMGHACEFRYSPSEPGQPNPRLAAWRLIGRTLCWDIESELLQHHNRAAIEAFLVPTKFGFDLTGGGPKEASLGLVIADEARRALVGSMPQFNADELRLLSQGLKRIYGQKPPVKVPLEHARLDILAGVQFVQDAYQREDWASLNALLGPDAKDPVSYLKSMREHDGPKRVQFFAGLAEEGNKECEFAQSLAMLPFSERTAVIQEANKKLKGVRPWKKLNRHLFWMGRSLLALEDTTSARTQMMILDAEILRTIAQTGQAPSDLSGFTPSLTMDPFSNRPFILRAGRRQYKLYSVGKDGADNNGEYDETYSQPDLKLERPIE